MIELTESNVTIIEDYVKSKRFDDMSMADIAVEYLRLGFSVIPTHSFTRIPKKKTDNPKKPCLPSWTLFQKERASEKLVRYWFEKQYKGANIAVVCGEVSGLVGIDIDSPQALEVLRMNFELPDTIMQKTGRRGGGWTAFFRYPIGENIGNSAGEVIEKVDVRGNGGYVIVPPSVHSETGKRYEWLHINPIEDGLADLLPLSEHKHLLRLCQKKKDEGVTKSYDIQGEKQIEVFEPVKAVKKKPWYVELLENGVEKGKRDVSTTRLAGYFKAINTTETVASAILTSWNRAKNNQPINDVFTDADVIKCVKSIYKDTVKIDYGWITGTALLTKAIKPLQWIVEGIFPEGVNLLGGKPKAGKTALAQNIAVSIALGTKALGNAPTVQGDVLFLSLEDNERRFQSRLREMLAHTDRKLDLSRLHITTKAPTGLELLDFLREKLTELSNPRMVIIDTLKKVRDRKGYKNKQLYDIDYEAVEVFTSIANEFNIAILVIHHCKKGNFGDEDPFEMLSGSTGLTAATDANHVLERLKGKTTGILHSIGNDLAETAVKLEFDPKIKSWTREGAANPELERLSDDQRKILDAFYSDIALGGQLTTKEVTNWTGLDPNYVRVTLTRLKDKGLIEDAGYGKWQLLIDIMRFNTL